MTADLVVSFNARPIVEALKRLGRTVAAVDYFGDTDIRETADYLFSVLNQQENEPLSRVLHRPTAQYLVELAEIMEEEVEIEKVIIGSGLDDYPELWERLSRLGNLCGNDPKILARVRDRPFLYEKAEEIGLKHPSIWSVTSEQALEKYKGDIDLPLVVKAARGGGGTHTKLCKTWEEVTRTVKDYLEVAPTCYLLEYIAGTPASVSIIANQEGCKVVAWNQQLIGCSFAAAPTPFTYVGNLTPLKIPKQIEPIIRRKFESLGHQLQLRGNNGFDFILTNKNEIYLLELNPRIQGSLEPIELATQQSLIQMHLDAFTGKLPLSSHFLSCRGYNPEKVWGKTI